MSLTSEYIDTAYTWGLPPDSTMITGKIFRDDCYLNKNEFAIIMCVIVGMIIMAVLVMFVYFVDGITDRRVDDLIIKVDNMKEYYAEQDESECGSMTCNF